MVKHKLACVLSALAIAFSLGTYFVVPTAVHADDEQSQNEEAVVVSDADTLYAALYWGGNYVLGANIDSADLNPAYGGSFFVFAETNLDLGDYTITLSGSTSSIYAYSDNLTLSGGQGKIVKSIENTEYPTVWAYGGDITMESGSIEGKKYPVMVSESRQFTMNGGTITGETFGVVGYGASTIVMNKGTVNAGEIGLLGRGTDTGTEITLNGGTINSGDTGIYSPQIDGVTTINGGEINAALNGVEVRAGTLNITDGKITVPSDVEYKVIPNGSGTTTTGSAVSVAQHTTKKPISVNIFGGTFDAPVAFSEANPQKNSEEDIKKVTAEITGGTFGGEIKSEDLVDFVNGGQFTIQPAEEDIVPGHEAEETYKGSGIYEIVPINIDWKDDYLEKAYNDDYAVVVDFHAELIADHRASLNVAEKTDLSGYKLTNGGDLLMALDVDMVDRNNTRIEVKDNNLEVFIDLSEEDYNKLAAYDKVQIVYLDENGNEVERLDATLHGDNGWYWVQFTTTHLSTYGIVGVNESGSGTPETGTMTAAGASAANAAIVTAIAVGLLTSIVSFAYLIRRR